MNKKILFVVFIVLALFFKYDKEVSSQVCNGVTSCCYECDPFPPGDPETCDYQVGSCLVSGGSCGSDPNACNLAAGEYLCDFGQTCSWEPPPGGATPTPGGGGGDCAPTGGQPACAGNCPGSKECKKEDGGGCKCKDTGGPSPTPTPSCAYNPGQCGWLNECPSNSVKWTEQTPGSCNPSYNCVYDPGCRPDACLGTDKSASNLNIGSSITITVNGILPASPPDNGGVTIEDFWLAFYNNPTDQGIYFQPGIQYVRKYSDAQSCNKIDSDTCVFTINWSDLNYIDLNTGLKPNDVQVNGYIVLSDGGFSVADGLCVETFTVQQNTNPTCSLTQSGTQNVCLNSTQSYTANCSDGQTAMSATTIYSSAVGTAPTWNTICSDADGSCTGNKTWSTAGNYWVTVNGTDSVTYSACSGNPWCEWEPVQATQISCGPSGFTNCSVGTDTLLVTVSSTVGTPTLNTPTTACPGTPGNVTPQASLSWSAGGCATSYQVYRCDATTSPGCTPGSLVATVTGTTTTNNVPNPTHNYRYRVRACNGATCSTYSAIQEVGPFMIPPATSPVTASCTGGIPQMDIGWGTGSCVETFNLERCEKLGGGCTSPPDTFSSEATITNNGSPVTYSDTGPFQPDYYYSYRLQSCTNGFCTGSSSITSAQNVCPTCSPSDIALVPFSPSPMLVGGTDQLFSTSLLDGSVVVDSVDYSSIGVGSVSFLPDAHSDNGIGNSNFTANAHALTTGSTSVKASVNLEEPGGTVVLNACSLTTQPFTVYQPTCDVDINGDLPIQLSAGTIKSAIPVNVDVFYNPTVTPTPTTQVDTVDCSVSPTSVADFVPPGPLTLTGANNFVEMQGFIQGAATATCTAHVREVLFNGSLGNEVATCTQNVAVTVYNESWWKIEGGDVISNGPVRSCIPPSAGIGDSALIDGITTDIAPGILNYNDPGQSPSLCSGTISIPTVPSTSFKSNTTHNVTKNFDYYFNKLPSDFLPASNLSTTIDETTLIGNPATCIKSFDGYCWYLYDGDDFGGADVYIKGNNINLQNGRVVLFVKNANLLIESKINFTNGLGFAMIIVDGNISVLSNVGETPAGDPPTDSLEGIFVSEGFITESLGLGIQDLQLVTRGVIYAQTATLNRDLFDLNNSLPSEYFKYDPAVMFMIPDGLKDKKTFFREVAP